MTGYFINAELRRSTGIFLSLMCVFLLLTIYLLHLHHAQLKADYIDTMGAIAARLVEEDPASAQAIMPLITKAVTTVERQKGRALLAEFGLTDDLEGSLFPYLNQTIRKNNFTVSWLFALLTLLLFELNYFQHAFFYQRIRRITFGAQRIIEGDYDIAIHQDEEGDFSKLTSAFHSMGSMIRSQFADLKAEKQFLVDLMSDISHQLKTPLSSLIVYNDIMLQKELTTEQRANFLDKTQAQLERMKWLIHSILKLARLDARSIEFDLEEQSLNETVHNAIDALESKATSAHVQIHFFEEGEVTFPHDRLWVEEAIINILKNGIEHTPSGGKITITIAENPLYRRVSIEDTGEGIAREVLPNIFKRFFKVQTARKSDSLGIGLALARSIVEAHNGVIEAQSELGVGTKFIMTFLR